jgi:AraC-like DNA-binding protein
VFRNIPKTDYILIKETLQFVKDVFTPYDEVHKKSPQFRENVPDYLICRLKAGILTVISDILRDEDYSESVEKTSVLLRLQKALDFMDTNFLENPPLSKIAKKVFMAPNYFHKVFRDTFGITPFEYMLNKRMNIAKELLGFSSLNIKQIAEQSGYEDEFYFSKMFKKHTGVSPAKFRSHGI